MPTDTAPPSTPRLVTGAGFKALVDPEILLQTSRGDVLLQLNTAAAPATVANMLAYARDGFYTDTLFHRVIAGFMAQGGGLTTGMVVKTPTYDPIPLESNNGQLNLRGTIAMARTNVADSATAQFFINLVDNAFLNYASAGSPGYAVFGAVVTGMGVIDNIATTATTTVGAYADVPVADILITGAMQTVVGSSLSTTGVFSLAGLEVGGRFDYSLDGGQQWLAGTGSSFTVPAGSYAAGAIRVRQFDAAGNQNLQDAQFADALTVNPSANVTANQAPTGVLRVTGTATLGQTVLADTSTLADANGAGNLATPAFQWLRNGEFIPGATGSSYVLGAQDVGAALGVRLTYTDGLGRVEKLLSGGNTLAGDSLGNLLTGSDYADLLTGLDGNDTLAGSFGPDTLQGGPGADTLDGGAGADSLVGGTGDDVYLVDSLSDVVVEAQDGGIDEVRTALSYPQYVNSSSALGAHIERLTLTGSGNVYGLGNDLANRLTGNAGANTLLGAAGHDTLLGGEGNDVLEGGSGNDVLDGGGGLDIADYSLSPAPVTAELWRGAALQDGLGGQDTLTGIEILVGSGFNDLLAGGASADTLSGGAGNDGLYAAGGNDRLIGGAGNDTMDGGPGFDVVSYSGAGSSVTAEIWRSYALNDGQGGQDALWNIEALIGSNFADLLAGGAGNDSLAGGGSNDGLYAAGGDDTLVGGGGLDTLDGGPGFDLADYSAATAPVTAELWRSYALNDGQGSQDALWNIEALLGSAFNDLLAGGAANESLSGGSGNDGLYAAGGQDTLVGGAGNDTLDGGAGNDLADYSAATGAVTAELWRSFALNDGQGGQDALWNIEHLIGSAQGDLLAGTTGDNQLTGLAGNDQIYAAAGNDTLAGGLGLDTLNGGAGQDIFLFDTTPSAGNLDTVQDFSVVDDTLQLSGLVFTALGAAGPLAAGLLRAGAGVSAAADADDFLLYNSSTGLLSYDPDAQGAAPPVPVALLGAGLALGIADFLVV
ncbi:MAG: peptidylprolyl isomerase [Rhodoferax sp.]|nr:peptidylprolyl isomerase [Rhodoferax sp.]